MTAVSQSRDPNVEFLKTDPDLPPVGVDRSIPDVTGRAHPARRDRHWSARSPGPSSRSCAASTSTPCGSSSAAVCTYMFAFRFYARLIRTEIVKPRDDRATPAEILENGKRLHADRSSGAVRSPLRGDRRRRSPGRTRARRADGLPARNDVDHRRRRVRRCGAGLPGAVDLDATPRAQPRSDGPRGTRPRRRHRGVDRRVRHHDHPHRGARHWWSSTRSPRARGASSRSR